MAGPQTPAPSSMSPSLPVSGLLLAAPQLFRVQPRPGTEPAAAPPPPPLPPPPPRAPEAGLATPPRARWPRPAADPEHAQSRGEPKLSVAVAPPGG